MPKEERAVKRAKALGGFTPSASSMRADWQSRRCSPSTAVAMWPQKESSSDSSVTGFSDCFLIASRSGLHLLSLWDRKFLKIWLYNSRTIPLIFIYLSARTICPLAIRNLYGSKNAWLTDRQ